MEEIWKDIKGYEGLYQVSNYGNIRVLIFHNNVCKKTKIKNLKKQIDKYGRERVVLYKNKKAKCYQVHRLVAETFLYKNKYKKMASERNIDIKDLEVNHKDENPLNNCVDNLEWCTHLYNMNYGTNYLRIAKSKTKKPIQIYKNKIIKKWNSLEEAANYFGVSKQTISMCCLGITKTSCGYNWRY